VSEARLTRREHEILKQNDLAFIWELCQREIKRVDTNDKYNEKRRVNGKKTAD